MAAARDVTPITAGRWAKAVAVFLATVALTGCASLGYYAQAVSGHLAVLNSARPVAELLDDPSTPESLKARLKLTQRIREFASAELALPRNASYTRYADLKRSHVTWNVVATPELSLELKSWCFPVAGCVGYRGYFSEADAQATAAALRAEGLEAYVYGVPAYSTLGKLDWLGAWGADPLLNTFIGQPEGELARLIFHELAHQVLYVPGDTAFNEAFATAVEQLGAERWLSGPASSRAQEQYAAFSERRRVFRDMALTARAELQTVYANASATDEAKRQGKARVFASLRQRYAAVRAEWVRSPQGGEDPRVAAFYDRWFAQAGNPQLAIMAAYDEGVPAFLRLFEREGRSFVRFYDAVKALAALPADERRRALAALAP